MTSQNSTTREIIEGYEILKKIGQGGMGAVYRARQKSMDRVVALKILPKSLAKRSDFKERFFREARAAGRLNHPNIVTAIDAQESNGYCYIAMEFVDGDSVTRKIKQEGHLSEAEALSIARQIAMGLRHAWESDIVHRDVKPENFLYTSDGVAKLCDLGIAKAPTDAGLTQEGMAVGTPRYIAPEQARGLPDIDKRADVYSLGASLYHMLAGVPPFDGTTPAVIMLKHINDPLPPLQDHVPGISKGVAALVAKMMAKEPEKRYQDAETLLEDLDAVLAGEAPVHAVSRTVISRKAAVRRSVAPVARRAKSRTDSSSKTGLIVGCVFAVLVIAFFVRIQTPSSDPIVEPASSTEEVAPDASATKADASRLFAEAREYEKQRAFPKALELYHRIIQEYPRSEYVLRAQTKLDAFEQKENEKQQEAVIRKRVDLAATALVALRKKRNAMPEDNYTKALKAFSQKWKGTPAADQAWGDLNAIYAEINLREEQRALLTPKGAKVPLAGSFEEAKKILTGADQGPILPLLKQICSVGSAARPFLPELFLLAQNAPKAEVRTLSFQAIAALVPWQALERVPVMLTDRNEAVRLAVVDFLVGHPEVKGRQYLKGLAGGGNRPGDPSPRVRNAAHKAIQKLK